MRSSANRTLIVALLLALVAAPLLATAVAPAHAQAPPPGVAPQPGGPTQPPDAAAPPEGGIPGSAPPPKSLASAGEPESDEAEVREVLETMKQGIKRKDLQFAMSRFSPSCDTGGRTVDATLVGKLIEQNKQLDLRYEIDSVKPGPNETLIAEVDFSLITEFDPIDQAARLYLDSEGMVVKVEPIGPIAQPPTGPPPAPYTPNVRPDGPDGIGEAAPGDAPPADAYSPARPAASTSTAYNPAVSPLNTSLDRMTPENEDTLTGVLPENQGDLDDRPDPKNEGIDYGNFR